MWGRLLFALGLDNHTHQNWFGVRKKHAVDAWLEILGAKQYYERHNAEQRVKKIAEDPSKPALDPGAPVTAALLVVACMDGENSFPPRKHQHECGRHLQRGSC